jgi:glycerol-3-phosphate dehydrogenase
MTVCASGPWTDQLTSQIRRSGTQSVPALMKGMNVITRPLGPEVAFGVRSARRSDAVIGESRRMYFATPSPGCSIIGTTHFPYEGSPDNCEFTEQDVADFLAEFNAAYPAANLEMNDVIYWHGGLTPAEEGDSNEVVRGHQAEIIDHKTEDNLDGVISVVGVKYTTARLVAENAVDLVFRKTGERPPPCAVKNAILPGALPHVTDQRFATYGALATEVSSLMPEGVDEAEAAFLASCRYALESEMAVRLDDLLLRRTCHARQGLLNTRLLDQAASLMASHFGWSDTAKQAEIDRAYAALARQGTSLER